MSGKKNEKIYSKEKELKDRKNIDYIKVYEIIDDYMKQTENNNKLTYLIENIIKSNFPKLLDLCFNDSFISKKIFSNLEKIENNINNLFLRSDNLNK
jgi:hypothetical protein